MGRDWPVRGQRLAGYVAKSESESESRSRVQHSDNQIIIRISRFRALL